MPRHPDNAPRGPFEDDSEGPYFRIRAMQLQAIAAFAGSDEYATVQIEARGGGYWKVTRVDADGNLTDESTTIWPEETKRR